MWQAGHAGTQHHCTHQDTAMELFYRHLAIKQSRFEHAEPGEAPIRMTPFYGVCNEGRCIRGKFDFYKRGGGWGQPMRFAFVRYKTGFLLKTAYDDGSKTVGVTCVWGASPRPGLLSPAMPPPRTRIGALIHAFCMSEDGPAALRMGEGADVSPWGMPPPHAPKDLAGDECDFSVGAAFDSGSDSEGSENGCCSSGGD